MKLFTKKEFIGVSLIFLVVFSVTYSGLLQALRRSRDVQRKADISNISDALSKYQEDMGFFPPSENGKIKACRGENFESIELLLKDRKMFDLNILISGLRPCDWGIDALKDVLDDSYPAYLSAIPQDPKAKEGYHYYYFSNSRRFQIYTFLEGGQSEDDYSENITSRNISCGTGVCSYGKSSDDTPLDRSI